MRFALSPPYVRCTLGLVPPKEDAQLCAPLDGTCSPVALLVVCKNLLQNGLWHPMGPGDDALRPR